MFWSGDCRNKLKMKAYLNKHHAMNVYREVELDLFSVYSLHSTSRVFRFAIRNRAPGTDWKEFCMDSWACLD